MHGLPLCLWVVLENSSLIACTAITLSKNLGFSSICFEMSAQNLLAFFLIDRLLKALKQLVHRPLSYADYHSVLATLFLCQWTSSLLSVEY